MCFSTAFRHSKRASFVTEVSSNMSMVCGLPGLACRKERRRFDFKNAFPTMSHEMVAAALGLMCIPFLYIRLILHLVRAPYLYSLGKGYVAGVYHHPRAGTCQGDPLSPALFSLVASFVIFPPQDLDPGLTVMDMRMTSSSFQADGPIHSCWGKYG